MRHLLNLDQKRHLVLIIVAVATAIMWLGLLTIINVRRIESRENGAFYYVFFRQLYLLMFAVLYLPSAYMIEFIGVNKSMTLSMILCTVSLWMVFID
jgi:hypothetical protein